MEDEATQDHEGPVLLASLASAVFPNTTVAVFELPNLRSLQFVPDIATARHRPGDLQSVLAMDDPTKLLFEYNQYIAHKIIETPGRALEGASVLIAGVGGCCLPHALHIARPDLRLTLIEADAAVAQVARNFFFLDRLEQDGAAVHTVSIERFLESEESQNGYDVIVLDVFDSSFAPDITLTQEFVENVKKRWTGTGAVFVNYVVDPVVQNVEPTLSRWRDIWGERPCEVYRCVNSSNVIFSGY